MNYATLEDMTARFGEREMIDLTDRAQPRAGAIDETILETALGDASAEIDAALLRAGYALPQKAIPPLLISLCCDIARYRLTNRIAAQDAKSEPRLRYEDARETLKAIATGRMAVDGLSPQAEEAPAGVSVGRRALVFTDAIRAAMDPRP